MRERNSNNPPCKRCGASDTIRRGTLNGIVRYKCLSCGRYFSRKTRLTRRKQEQIRMLLKEGFNTLQIQGKTKLDWHTIQRYSITVPEGQQLQFKREQRRLDAAIKRTDPDTGLKVLFSHRFTSGKSLIPVKAWLRRSERGEAAKILRPKWANLLLSKNQKKKD